MLADVGRLLGLGGGQDLAIKAGAAKAGSGSCHQGMRRQGVFWVVPSRRLGVVAPKQFRVLFAVGEAITEAHGSGFVGASLVGRICLLHSQQASQVWIRSML